MNQKLLSAWTVAKTYAAKLYSYSPFYAGVAIGYFGRPFFQPLIAVAYDFLKLALHL